MKTRALETVVYGGTEVRAQVLSPRTSTWSNVLTTLEAVSGRCDRYLPTHEGNAMTKNFGDWQWTVYGDAVHGISSRFPFDFESIERKAFDAMPDWIPVCLGRGRRRSHAARNIDAYSRYGIIPRMMVSPPERDLSINLFGNHLPSPMFMAPIGLIGLCSPDFQGDVAAAQASANTGVPFTLSTFSQPLMDDVIKHAVFPTVSASNTMS